MNARAMRHLQLADTFEIVADSIPDELALLTNESEYTYAQLDERATRLANHLRANRIDQGDHVGVHARNCVEWVDAFYACAKLRALAVNVNYRYQSEELRYLYDNADCVAVIVAGEFREAVDDVADALPRLRHTLELGDEYEAALAGASPARDFAERSADDHYILYTGGTTGMPKGVIWRHEDVLMAAMNAGRGGKPIERPEQLGEEAAAAPFRPRLMAIGPMMHGSAQYLMGNAFTMGATMVLYTLDHFDPVEVWRLAESSKANSVSTIGDAMGRPLAQVLVDADGPAFDLSSVFSIGNGGAALTPAVRQMIATVLPNVLILDTFGSSESGAAAAGTSSDPASLPTFVANPDIAVLDDDGNACPAGAVGRIARCGHIPLRYHKDEAKSASTFPTYGGRRWVVTGDFGSVGDDGNITFLGRGSICINSGGEKIYPEEVESALKRHPDVFEAVVVGTPSPRWGEQVTALVQARDGAPIDADDVRRFARTLVADYKVPKVVVVVPEVRHTPVGKLDYSWARAEGERLVAERFVAG